MDYMDSEHMMAPVGGSKGLVHCLLTANKHYKNEEEEVRVSLNAPM